MLNLTALLASICLIVVLYAPQPTSALIPKACVSNATKPAGGVCCPVHENGYVCGGPRRGHCAQARIFKDSISTVYLEDDRVHWPSKFFSHLCQCEPNFFGVACGECWYNRRGKYCDKKRLVTRKNVNRLNRREQSLLLRVLDESRRRESDYAILVEDNNEWSDPIRQAIYVTGSVQYFLTALHRFASRSTLFENDRECELLGILDFNHDDCGFPTWHRYFMTMWERELEKIAQKHFGEKEFALPYWDWEDLKYCDICHNDLVGAEGEVYPEGTRIHHGSIFSNWTEYCSEPEGEPRCYGCHRKKNFGLLTRNWNNLDFPTSEDVDFMLKQRTYCTPNERDNEECNTFRKPFEGYCNRPGVEDERLYVHNRVHNMVDGSMCCSASATNDPVFILHHVNIDRLFTSWMEIHDEYDPRVIPNEEVRPGHARECNMVGFIPSVAHKEVFVRTEELGYRYDRLRTLDSRKRQRH